MVHTAVLLLALLQSITLTQAASTCHIFSYSGSCHDVSGAGEAAPGSASASCTTSSFCLPRSTCNTTLFKIVPPVPIRLGQMAAASTYKRTVRRAANGALANDGAAEKVTGCANLSGIEGAGRSQVVCDGQVYGVAGSHSSSYQCICDDDTSSCPSGTASVVENSDGSTSSENLPSGVSSLTFTWLPPSQTSNPSAGSPQNLAAAQTPSPDTTAVAAAQSAKVETVAIDTSSCQRTLSSFRTVSLLVAALLLISSLTVL